MIDALVGYIVNAVWQIPLVAIGAAAATRISGLGSRGRHLTWIGALVLAVLLPAAPLAGALAVAIQPSTTAAAVVPLVAPPAATLALPPIVIDAGVARVLAWVFGLAVAVGAARIALAWRAASALARRSGALELSAGVADALAATALAHRIAPPPVRLSEEIRGPVVVGHRAPAILVPRAFARLPEDQQKAALLHELAHVVRRDFAMNLICEAVALPGCWHPVLYEIKAGARRSREVACDALAARAMGSRDVYARRLIALADALRLREGDEPSVAMVALISRGDLEERLMQLIKRPRAPTKLRLMVAAAMAGALLAPAALLHVTPALADPAAAPAIPTAPAAAPAIPTAPAAAANPSAIAAPAIPAPVASPAERLSPPRLARHAHRVVLARTAFEPPAPPAPPQLTPAPPAPPAMAPQPPAPPEPPMVDEAEIRQSVRHAALAAAAASRALASAEVQRALAEVSAQRAQLAGVDREAIRRQVAEVMASSEVQHALAEARRAANSEEVRKAVAQAREEAARANAEARAAARDADRP